MSSALNKNWAYAMIYRDDLFIKACQVDVEGSGMTSDDLILDICQPNQTYRIAYYNVEWEVIQVDVVQTPKELAITYAGKNTVIVTYPYNAGEQIEIVPSNPSTLHHTSSKGQSIFNGLNPNQNYSVILRDSNDKQIDIVKVKTNDLQVPTVTVLNTTDKRIVWRVSNAKHLTAKVYKSDNLYGTIEQEVYIGSNLQDVGISNLEIGKSYTMVVENNPEWIKEVKTNSSTLMNYYDFNLSEYEVVENLLPNVIGNYRDRKPGSVIKAIVVHWTAAPNQEAINTRQHFVDTEDVSSNYIIGATGEVMRVAPDDKTTYANGGTYLGKPSYTELVYERFVSSDGYRRHNDFAISIETNPIDNDGNFSNEAYTALVRLTADLMLANNLNTADGLYRHHDFTSKDCPKLFVNPGESHQYYYNEDGDVRAKTPTMNLLWEQFKANVDRAMIR